MVDHRVRVAPGELALLRLDVGPGEELDDPRRAHLAHHAQGALDLPPLHLIGEARVDTGDGVRREHLLGWIRHHQNPGWAEGREYEGGHHQSKQGG